MSGKRLWVFAVTTLLGAGLTFIALAHDGEGDDGIRGIEHLHRSITLTATTNAPAGATGKAEFFASCATGTNAATLLVETEGLTDGTYSVSVTDDTGTNTYVLGTFDVVASATEVDDDQGDDNQGDNNQGDNHQGDNNQGDDNQRDRHGVWTNGFVGGCAFTNHFNFCTWTNQFCPPQLSNNIYLIVCTNWLNNWTNWSGTCICTNRHRHGDDDEVENQISSFVLPGGVNPLTLATISISDSNGVVDLTGDLASLTNTESCDFHADCIIVPGTNCPAIHGHAVMTSATNKGKTHGTFQLTAQGAPPRHKFILLVDGVVRGTVRSDKGGNIKIKNLHQKNLVNVKSVVVIDSGQNVVCSVKF